VNITGEKGAWLEAQTNEPFDPEKLQIEIFDYVLPDNETLRLAAPSYDGKEAFGFTDVNVQGHYVIYPDGSRDQFRSAAE
jgi:hypothetical protein